MDQRPAGSPAPPVVEPRLATGQVPTTTQTRAIVGELPAFRRRLGSSDLHVFPLALNGNVFGWRVDGPTTQQILDRYWLHGGNFLDTADCYAGGRSEIMIGTWMASRRNRDQIVISTKVGKGADFPGVTARAITSAVHDSLRRLRTDRIDLLSLHVDDPAVPFEETLTAVDDLIRAGKVRYFGTAQPSATRLYEARVASAQLGVAPMTAVQAPYNLVERRSYEREIASAVQDLGLALMPRFALASGFLTGKYRTRAAVSSAVDYPDALARYISRPGLKVVDVLQRVAFEQGTSMPGVAIAWLLSRPSVVAPIVSAWNVGQVHELTAAHELVLTRHQLAALDRVSARL